MPSVLLWDSPLPSLSCFHCNVSPSGKYLATSLSAPTFPLGALLRKGGLVLSSQGDGHRAEHEAVS